MASVTATEHTVIGALSGLLEPTVAIKNALQEGRPVPRSVPALYRGLGMNICSMFPITATQFGSNRFLEQAYERMTGQRPGFGGSLLVAMGAGATSALLGCPSEFIVIHQQKTGHSLPTEASRLLRTYGPLKLYKGLGATVIRESLYTASYLGIFPVLRDFVDQQTPVGGVPGGPLVVAGISAGLLGATATHPADTIKTRMQAFPDNSQAPQYRSMASTAQHIFQTEGARGFFAGLLPRAFRISGAVIILNTARTGMVDALQDRRMRSAL
ncbi:hypothetical protein N2152v2_009248 [Parachlorella kessleri]